MGATPSIEDAGLAAKVYSRNPWAWRPSASSWFEGMARLVTDWQPSPELEMSAGPLTEAMSAAARREERWLLHPCINPLTMPVDDWQVQRDFQLAVWAAAHSVGTFGTVMVPRQLWAWSPGGGVAIAPGVYDLADLGAAANNDAWPWPIAFDTWARSVGFPPEQSWGSLTPSTSEEKTQLQREATQFLRASAAAQRNAGDLFDWVTAMTQVVVPLRRIGARYSKSNSCRQLPGAVSLTIHNEMQVLEALVHETAHNYLFLAEVEEPLVDPAHVATYRSPLRSDLRPLIGIMLAYHALAYIAAYYFEALRSGFASPRRCEEELRATREMARDCEQTLDPNRRFLTGTGKDFLESTWEVTRFSEN